MAGPSISASPHPEELQPTFPDLQGKLVLVTGSSTGIGAEIARQFARNGATPVLIGRREDKLQGVAAEIAEKYGVRAPYVLGDLGEGGTAARIVKSALEIGPDIDVVVHCAGMFHYGPFDESGTELLDEMYRANVRGPYDLTRAALPFLAPNASVVFIGSNVGQMGYPFTAPYTASKGGEEALARCLAVELAPRGIRVNIVSPGLVKTDMTIRMQEEPELEAAATAVIPAGRLGETREIAAATLYLASAASSYVVGTTLTIDGGHSVP